MKVKGRMAWLAVAAMAACVACGAPAEERPVRYVSSAGDDAADGLTPQTAWRTIRRLLKGLPSGGEARLRRGDTFYGCVRLRQGRDAEHRTVLTAYGDGPAPVLTAMKIFPRDPAIWEDAGQNMWRIRLKDYPRMGGYSECGDANVGYLKVDGTIFGRKFFRQDGLSRQWDFWDDHTNLVVWSAANPATLARELKVATNVRMIRMSDHIEVRGIEVRGTGGHGVCGTGVDVRISDCGFHEIGGSHLRGHGVGTSRYGNGVECWAGSADIQVTRCSFSHIYDVAFTLQGPNPPRSWEDISFTDCVVSNCTQAFELWTRKCRPGIGMKNILFARNLCVDTSRNWGYEVRPDKITGTPLLMYGWQKGVQCDVLVTSNRFVNSRGALVHKSGGLSALPADYRIEGNVVIGPPDAPITSERNERRAADEDARAKLIRERNTFQAAK